MRLAKEGDALKLYWQELPLSDRPVVWHGKDSRVLLEFVEEFKVDYRPEFDLQWQNEGWDAEGAPALVRLTIKAKGRYWPDLIVRVQR